MKQRNVPTAISNQKAPGMADPDDEPQISYSVEMSASGATRLRVKIRDKEIPLTLSPDQAGQVGRALLAASALSNSISMLTEGTVVENCHFPVLRWGTGYSNGNGLRILLVEVPGGTQLTLQFDRTTAQQCSAGLARVSTQPSNTD